MKEALKKQEPKQRMAFRNKYLAAILAVVALLICSVASAQTDSLKYSQINGYGFKYKRHVQDSVCIIPLSTSPHTPYRKGGIRYKAADSTLQLWTGYQWLSIVTGVGNGVDTAYALNDSTIAIETPNQDFFVKLSGANSIRNQFASAQDASFYIDSAGRMRYLQVDSFATFAPIAAPAYAEGRLFYDNTNKTYTIMDDISGTSIQLSYENLVRARNNTGSTINDGQVVYISGALGQNPTIALAQANSIATSQVIGLATHNISNNTIGKVTTFGLVNDINTSAFNDGDRLYLSQTTPGALTNVEPTNGISSFVGVCLLSHITQGKIFVHAQDVITTLQKVLNNNSTLTENENIVLADSLEFTSGLVVIDSLRLRTLTITADTTTYKPIAVGTNGRPVKFPHWPGGGAGSVTQVNTGYGLSGGPITTTGTAVVDTTTLKAVYLPLHLNSAKAINQAGNNITFIGGGMVVFDSTRHTITYYSPTLLADSLVTFGNSITAGLNSTVQDSAYTNRIASYYGLPLTNKGVSSTLAYGTCASNLAYINPGHSAMVTFCIGLNDYRNNGGGATMYRGVKNAYEAAMINHFLQSYVPASDASVTRYGSWTTNYNAVTNSGGKTTMAAYSSTTGDSLTVDITGTSIALGVIGLFGNLKDCIVEIDNVIVDSFSTSAQTANVGTTYMSMGKYYTGLSSGSHHVKVRVGPGSNFLLVDYIGTFVPPASMQPFVFVHVPHMDATGYAGGSATEAIIDAGNDSLTNAYNRALSAGLNVYLARTNDYYIATTSSGLSSDHIHPNDLGHGQIFSAIKAGLSSATATAGTIVYSNDGHFYGTKADNSLNQIAYAQDITLQRAISNGSGLTNPAYISGTNTLDFAGFSRIGLLNFKILSSNNSALMHGMIGASGAQGAVFVGSRGADSANGFQFYTSSGALKIFDTYNGKDQLRMDTGYRTALFNNSVTSSFGNATATLHIGGNTNGVAGHAPFKIDTCTLMATPEKYAIEATADSLYWTNNAGQRVALNRIGATDGNGIYGGNGSLPSDVTVTGGNNSITWDDIFSFNIFSDYNTIAKANGTGKYTEAIIGAPNQYWLGYTPTAGVYSKGVGIVIDTNENVGIGTAPPTAMPLYATGASFFVQGFQSNAGNFSRVDNVTTTGNISLTNYFITIDATAGNVTLTLPSASTAFGNFMGIKYKFQRIDASGNTVTIQRAGSDTINGGTSFTITTQYTEIKEVQCTSTSTWAQN